MFTAFLNLEEEEHENEKEWMLFLSLYLERIHHYIPKISNLVNKLFERNFPWNISPIKKLSRLQRNFHYADYIKFNAMEITLNFLEIFTSFFNFQCFECDVFAFSLKIKSWKLRKSSCCNEWKVITFTRINAISMAWSSKWTQYL